MKKIIFFVATLLAFSPFSRGYSQDTINYPASANDIITTVATCVIHGIPLAPDKDVLNFLYILKGDRILFSGFNEFVTRIADSSNMRFSSIFLGKSVEYIISSDSSDAQFSYFLFFVPAQDYAPGQVMEYKIKSKGFVFPWLDMGQNVTLSSYDPTVEIKKYSNFVAELMLLDAYIPHKVASRLSYNLSNPDYLDIFLEIMEKNGLKVEFSNYNKDLSINHNLKYGKSRKYKIRTSMVFGPTFEVDPEW